jgi:hypothetical protein
VFHVKRFGTIDSLRKCTFTRRREVRRGDFGRAKSCDRIKLWPCDFCSCSNDGVRPEAILHPCASLVFLKRSAWIDKRRHAAAAFAGRRSRQTRSHLACSKKPTLEVRLTWWMARRALSAWPAHHGESSIGSTEVCSQWCGIALGSPRAAITYTSPGQQSCNCRRKRILNMNTLKIVILSSALVFSGASPPPNAIERYCPISHGE